jgi:outer membrane protein OmpA-like peptidoglycan-associated protein
MKTLLFGFLVLIGWSVLSTHIYVCNIKGLCNGPVTVQINAISHKDTVAADSLNKPLLMKQAIIPKDLITYFAFDKYEFNSDIKTSKYFDESNGYLVKNAQARLNITGYTDAVGSDEYNQALGYKRAQSLQYYFESKGIPANKIQIESKGEKEPADDNNTPAGRANNRRTVITIKH